MTDLRTAAQQALEAMRCGVPTGKITLYAWDKAMAELKAALTEDAMQRLTDVSQEIEAALAEPVQEPTPMPPFPPVSLWKRGCAVCGIGAGGHAYGYVCPRSDCPTRVTCGGVDGEELRIIPPQRPAEPVAYSVGRTLHWHDGKGVNDAQLYLAAPPQRKPLTEEVLDQRYYVSTGQMLREQEKRLAFLFARAIEQAHGITS